jgi:hypothetical protein
MVEIVGRLSSYQVEDRIRQSGCSRVQSKHFSRGHFVGSLDVFLGGCDSLAGREGVDVGDEGAELEGVDEGDACGVDDADIFVVTVSENVAVIGTEGGVFTTGGLPPLVDETESAPDLLSFEDGEARTFESLVLFMATIQLQ